MIYDKVIEYITAQLPVDASKISKDSRLVEDLGADSANLMMLIMDLETEFDIPVSDEVLGTIKTVGNIVDYLEAHV